MSNLLHSLLLASPWVLASISQFFDNLRGDLTNFALAANAFFFAWSAILFMSAGQNDRRMDHAKATLYAALGGLALVLLSNTIAILIANAARGQ